MNFVDPTGEIAAAIITTVLLGGTVYVILKWLEPNFETSINLWKEDRKTEFCDIETSINNDNKRRENIRHGTQKLKIGIQLMDASTLMDPESQIIYLETSILQEFNE